MRGKQACLPLIVLVALSLVCARQAYDFTVLEACIALDRYFATFLTEDCVEVMWLMPGWHGLRDRANLKQPVCGLGHDRFHQRVNQVNIDL
jgi:hypothetical protein